MLNSLVACPSAALHVLMTCVTCRSWPKLSLRLRRTPDFFTVRTHTYTHTWYVRAMPQPIYTSCTPHSCWYDVFQCTCAPCTIACRRWSCMRSVLYTACLVLLHPHVIVATYFHAYMPFRSGPGMNTHVYHMLLAHRRDPCRKLVCVGGV